MPQSLLLCYFILSCFLSSSCLLSPCSLLHLITHTHTHTHTLGRTPLNEGSACRRDIYLTTHNNHKSHSPSGIRTRNLSKRAAADRRLRPDGHRDRLSSSGKLEFLNVTAGCSCRIALPVAGSKLNMFCAHAVA
jgi:hypothetical protein